MIIIIFIIFTIFFMPYFAERFIEGKKVTKEKYIQNLKLNLCLFIILSIPVFFLLDIKIGGKKMLIFPMKKEWYEKIKSGEKTIEYREVKPYWTVRIFNDLKRELKKRYPNSKEKVETLELQEFLEMEKECPIVFEPDDEFTLQVFFRLGYGTEKLSAIITKIEIVDGKNTDLYIDKSVYAIHFKLGELKCR